MTLKIRKLRLSSQHACEIRGFAVFCELGSFVAARDFERDLGILATLRDSARRQTPARPFTRLEHRQF
jgi:hypothetical protein